MTPHILLLLSAEEIGGPLLVPIGNIAYAAPLGDGEVLYTRVFLRDRAEYIDVKDSFDAIVRALGGLVMRPFAPAVMPSDLR